MSILAALLIAQAGATALPNTPPSPEVAREMAKIDEQLADWKGGVYKRDGKLTCRIEDGTGDNEIDLIGCGALIRCFTPLADAMDAVAAADITDANRKRQFGELTQSAQPCIAAAQKAGTRILAERRQDG